MRPPSNDTQTHQAPLLQDKTQALGKYLQSLSVDELQRHMQLSVAKAQQTYQLLQSWSLSKSGNRPAIDAFLGDIYSGLQVQTFDNDDRNYANEHLLILSGLYGGLRALDSIQPYRLEMGYKLPSEEYGNLITYWGNSIAGLIPKNTTVINLSAVEYTKAVLPHIKNQVITPRFMTISQKTGEPTFVTVHAKITRGAFAHWLIKNRVTETDAFPTFTELGYAYDAKMSATDEPVLYAENLKGWA